MDDIFQKTFTPAGFSEVEWRARVDLALAYRQVDHYGWTSQVYNHISLRIPGTEHILINPFGLNYCEIKASNLVKIDLDGNKIDDSPYPVNKAGFIIHSALHRARSDLNCVLHTHNPDTIAVSALECGFIPLNQEGCIFHERIGYHDFEGIVLDENEQVRLIDAIGDTNHTLLLRNHGSITTGVDAATAFTRMYHLIFACHIQIKAMSTGQKIIQASEDALQKTRNQFETGASQSGAEVLLPEWPAAYRLMKRIDPNWDT